MKHWQVVRQTNASDVHHFQSTPWHPRLRRPCTLEPSKFNLSPVRFEARLALEARQVIQPPVCSAFKEGQR
jgi:hypothetical protein